MKVFLVADVGVDDGLFHVGDEAMFLAAIQELRARGASRFVATSTTPETTREQYGLDDAVGRLDFSAGRTPRRVEREDRLDDITRSALGETGLLEWDDPAWAVIEQIGDADAVLICGGGNLSSQWPEHVYERAGIGRIARALSTPLVVTGQTLGPALTQRDGELVAETLGSAVLVGVREGASHAVAESLGVGTHTVRTVDDAAFLEGEAAEVLPELPQDYCLATFAPERGSSPAPALVTRLAAFLDQVVKVTGLDVVLLPHHGSLVPGEIVGDHELHEQIRLATDSGRVRSLTVVDPVSAARVARGAALSVSTRYHPAVFALAAGVPSITISVDDYTDVKLAGALENFGALDGALSSIALVTTDAEQSLSDIWRSRDALRSHVSAIADGRRDEARAWWDAVADALTGGEPTSFPWRDADQFSALDPDLRERNSSLRSWVRDEGEARIGTAIASREGRDDIDLLASDVRAAELALGEATGDLEIARQRANEAHAALAAAQDLMARIAEPNFVRTLRRTPTVVHADELQALLNTRTFRWSRRPRAAYAALRRALRRG